MDIPSPFQKQWWQVMLSYLMKYTMCIILLTKHQRLFSILCFLGLCKIIRILYSLINAINQFCIIFAIAFNVGSLNCCQTNSSPFSQYIILLSYLVTIQNISKGTESGDTLCSELYKNFGLPTLHSWPPSEVCCTRSWFHIIHRMRGTICFKYVNFF